MKMYKTAFTAKALINVAVIAETEERALAKAFEAAKIIFDSKQDGGLFFEEPKLFRGPTLQSQAELERTIAEIKQQDQQPEQ